MELPGSGYVLFFLPSRPGLGPRLASAAQGPSRSCPQPFTSSLVPNILDPFALLKVTPCPLWTRARASCRGNCAVQGLLGPGLSPQASPPAEPAGQPCATRSCSPRGLWPTPPPLPCGTVPTRLRQRLQPPPSTPVPTLRPLSLPIPKAGRRTRPPAPIDWERPAAKQGLGHLAGPAPTGCPAPKQPLREGAGRCWLRPGARLCCSRRPQTAVIAGAGRWDLGQALGGPRNPDFLHRLPLGSGTTPSSPAIQPVAHTPGASARLPPLTEETEAGVGGQASCTHLGHSTCVGDTSHGHWHQRSPEFSPGLSRLSRPCQGQVLLSWAQYLICRYLLMCHLSQQRPGAHGKINQKSDTQNTFIQENIRLCR